MNKIFKEMRETYENLYPTASGDFDEFVTKILPRIIGDAEHVVHCKDCIHWGWDLPFETDKEKECEYAANMTWENHFCSFGKKKVNE